MEVNTAENGRAGQDFVLKYFPSVTMRSVSEEIGGQVTTTYRVKDADADQKITSTYVVVATGGFSIDPILAGILSPRWSYLTGINTVVAAPKDIYANDIKLPYDYSPNFFTWGYTHDWCIVNGYVRISGEDHYSAMKPPRMKERCQAMATWVGEKYHTWRIILSNIWNSTVCTARLQIIYQFLEQLIMTVVSVILWVAMPGDKLA